MSERLDRSEQVYTELFGQRDTTAADTDPEFGRILRTYIFGDLFALGELDHRTRELITVTALATLQALPQLRAHLRAALHVGVQPVELREAIYQLAAFIGFPRTLNALGVLNEVLVEQGVTLPLPDQGTTTDDDRRARGRDVQQRLYGTRMAQSLADLPAPYGEAVPALLTEWAFGDFATRNGLDTATRELLILCALATAGLDPQVRSHIAGALAAGNSPETVLAALAHLSGYAGFPAAVNAIRHFFEVDSH
ncbi:MAG: carboxymuconolactone decarboxylase family protein [Micropruina sp.]|nr:carboxymuconolactone decarboxylase family protein [Micropruina sp.]